MSLLKAAHRTGFGLPVYRGTLAGRERVRLRMFHVKHPFVFPFDVKHSGRDLGAPSAAEPPST